MQILGLCNILPFTHIGAENLVVALTTDVVDIYKAYRKTPLLDFRCNL